MTATVFERSSMMLLGIIVGMGIGVGIGIAIGRQMGVEASFDTKIELKECTEKLQECEPKIEICLAQERRLHACNDVYLPRCKEALGNCSRLSGHLDELKKILEEARFQSAEQKRKNK